MQNDPNTGGDSKAAEDIFPSRAPESFALHNDDDDGGPLHFQIELAGRLHHADGALCRAITHFTDERRYQEARELVQCAITVQKLRRQLEAELAAPKT